MMSLMTRGEVYATAKNITRNDTVKLTPAGAEFHVQAVHDPDKAGIDRVLQLRRIDGDGTDLRVEVLSNRSVRYRYNLGNSWSNDTTRVTWIGSSTDGSASSASMGLSGVFEGIRR